VTKTILRVAFCLLFFGVPVHARNPHVVNGVCGSADGVPTSTAPISNLCSAGTASAVTGTGPWYWSCAGSKGGTTASCSAPYSPAPINGQCGPANGVPASTAPTTGLCSVGLASSVTGTGPWNWSCNGSNGGTTASCSAPTQTGSNAGDFTFTPLHTYYMSATGNDSANGLTPGTAWATPNHNVVCGDVIIAAAGSYRADYGLQFGTVSNCPSTSGGIDGAGGIYFATLLCGGSDLEACPVSGNQVGQALFNVTKSNWAIEGFKCGGSGTNRCFMADAPNQTTVIHHIAFINNIAYNSALGFGMNDCPGGTCNHNVPGDGTDYWAVVGNIAQNSAQDGICLAAIDAVGPAQIDTKPGTHIYLGGNFSYNNRVSCSMDGENYMFDTWDAHGVTYQGVMENNVGWMSERFGLQIFYQAFNVSTPTIIVHNNTLFASYNGPSGCGDWIGTDINVQSNASNLPWIVSVYNNIASENFANINNSGSCSPIYAFNIGGNYTSTTIGGSGKENVFKGKATVCKSSCDPGTDVSAFNGGSFGTNIYVDPAFTNTADLLANRSGTPTCTGKSNVTQCMGWDARTQTLTTPSVVSDLTPTASGTSGKGYQRPSTTCAANALYPTWLKGIVYLRVVGSAIMQMSGLVTRPCGI
jgi:hypothetical protein